MQHREAAVAGARTLPRPVPGGTGPPGGPPRRDRGRRPTGHRGGRRRTRHRLAGYLFFAPFFTVFVAVIVLPLAYALYLSLYQDQLIGGTSFVGLANYTQAFEDSQFLHGVGRVALFLCVQVPVMLLLALACALAIDSGRLWFPKIFRLGIFIPYAVPAVVAALMWGYLYGGEFGLAGQVARGLGLPEPDLLGPDWMLASLANVVTWEFVGYNMLILYAALRTVPDEVYDSAEVDGAGELRKAWSIKLPALRPALLLTLIFSVIGSFQLFNEPSVMKTLAPSVITTGYTPNVYAYNLAFRAQDFNYSAAVSVVAGVATIAVAYVVQLVTARRERVL